MPSNLIKVLGLFGTASVVGCGIFLYLKFKGTITYDKPQVISELFEKKGMKLLTGTAQIDDPKWKRQWSRFRKTFKNKNPGAPWNIGKIWDNIKEVENVPFYFQKACERFKKAKITTEADPIYIASSTYCIE